MLDATVEQSETMPSGDLDQPGDRAESPDRRCIASGEVKEKAEMIRFVVSPDGVVTPDLAERLPGRGLWVTASREALETAVAKKAFARAAKRAVEVPADLADLVARLLGQRCLERLSLAKRAGGLVAGHDKVRAWLDKGQARLLLQAADGSKDECGRLARLGEAKRPDLRVVAAFTAEELGAALGRERAVHIALRSGGLSAALERDLLRFLAVQKGQEDARG